MPFKSSLDIRLIDDLANDGQGSWVLLSPLVYESNEGVEYVVGAGFCSDMASVPRAPVAFLLTGNSAHRAAVLHDYLLSTGIVPRPRADELFLEAMESVNMPPARVRRMYNAVRARTEQVMNPWGRDE